MSQTGVGIGRRTLALAAALVAAAAAIASQASGATLQERLERALASSGVPRAQTGAFAVDLRAGRTVFARRARRSLEPASNQKLLVSVAVLDRLGVAYRIPTEVVGVGGREGSKWRGRLYLKGFGDPTLSHADLRTLARRIRELGIRRVTGRVLGDESWFDTRRTAPGWKWSWYKVESPPLSALVVSRGKVNGRTVDDPALAAAAAFRDALRSAGVRVRRSPRVAAAPRSSTVLAAVRSAPLRRLIRKMNKRSDNFSAESLLKHLGRVKRGAGTTAAGAKVVRSELAARRVPLTGVRIVDGSGLSPLNRLTARALGRLLASAYRDAEIGDSLLASLPIAGVDGTLEERMETGAAYGNVRAKTGTTSTASSLSGYVRTSFVFSILQNGYPIAYTSARRAQDRFAQILARAP